MRQPLDALQTTNRDVALLLIASLACVLALTAALTHGAGSGRGLQVALLFAFIAGGALLALRIIQHDGKSAREAVDRARSENMELRAQLATAESITRAEPQILFLWEPDRPLRIVTNTLRNVPGLPADQPELLRFSNWLEPKSVAQLKSGLDSLFASGLSFNVILRTLDGGIVEADGRAAGGRAVLRLRDVAGYRRDLGQVMEQHERLARDILSSRALLDVLPMPAWIRGPDRRLCWVNRAYVDAVEMGSEAEVLSRQIELLESRQRKSIDRVLVKGESYRERLNLVIGGERKAHDVAVLPVGDAIAGAAIDITALENAQGELDRQIAAYNSTLDRISTAVAIFSAEQRLTFFNEAFARLWQLDAQWLQSNPSDGSILDKLRERGRLPELTNYRDWKAKVLSSYATGIGYRDVWHLPDGRTMYVTAEQRPDGGVTYLYADETERTTLETNYNALIRVQRETLDSLKEGVATFATDGRLKLYNRAFTEIWSLLPAALAREPHIDDVITAARKLYAGDRDWTAISREITAFSDTRGSITGQMVRPDNSVIDYATTPLPDGATLLTFSDVTDAKRYERALEEKNQALVAADKVKSQFIGHVSYELRTPLQSIIGFSELLASPIGGQMTAKQREYLEHIEASSKTLLKIVDGILDLATIDAGALELKLEPLSVRSVIEGAIQGIGQRAAEARLMLDIAVADDVDTFIGDGQRVQQVLYNILSNAVGFSNPGGSVRLSCWREAAATVFAIEDDGVGIPADQQHRVFERFESLSQGSKHRGTGLGLSVARELVQLHGGILTLASEPGRGTTVTVRFPDRVAGSSAGIEPRSIAS